MGCWGELKNLRAQGVGWVSAYWSCVHFSGCVEGQPGLQLVEELATPLTSTVS